MLTPEPIVWWPTAHARIIRGRNDGKLGAGIRVIIEPEPVS
jgi:hypothetical protein